MNFPDVLCFGEALIDRIGSIGVEKINKEEAQDCFGGAPANVACALAKLGVNVSFIGTLGCDLLGQRFKALLLDKNFEQENPKKFEELTDKTCKWPIGHPYEKNFYFCGRTSLEKFPYCMLHVLYAFQPKNAKEDDQISEEDVPKFIEKKIKSA